jgi:glycosyltransferase involved in cell wall biosynthesis
VLFRSATTRQGARRAAALPAARGLAAAVTVVETEAHPERLHEEYRDAAALLVTSRYESFGLVLLEALAHGAAVVAPALGGIPEVLGEDWPFLVRQVDDPEAYAAALVEATAPAARRHARAAAPALLRRFDPEVAAAGYLQLYQDAVAAGAAPPRPTLPGAM